VLEDNTSRLEHKTIGGAFFGERSAVTVNWFRPIA
jgi:hypothetical protein